MVTRGGAETADTVPLATTAITAVATSTTTAIWALLDTVADPEIPVLSVCDLGIVRDVTVHDDGRVDVVLTPTYSGCPATEVIAESVRSTLAAAGHTQVRLRLQRAPAWTTDWISAAGRRKMLAYGVAPPGPALQATVHVVRRTAAGPARPSVACPQCGGADTTLLSAFGATACKALYRCLACREPFEQFKPL
jgi:ring-1,2-phenylacetyl-CoA epoxidase subunit PaaD